MKTKSLLLWLMLLVGVMGAEAKEAYAYFEYDDNSLNFNYDNNKSYYSKSSDYIVYSLNTGSNTPAWNSRATSIEAVYFGNSFANYKPTTCFRWFDGMTNLEEVDGISNLNTSSVTRMDYMFRNCSKLTSLNLSTFNTQNVTTMYAMFDGCSKLTSLNVSGWSNTKVTEMTLMFDGCSNLTSINLSNFKTPSVKTMSCMFLNCKKLTSLNVSSFNTSTVSTFYRMFEGCSSLTSLDLSGFSAAKITSSDGMNFILNGCSALKTLKLSESLASCSYYTDYSCTGIGSTSSPCTLNYPTSVSLWSSFSTKTADYVKWKGGYFKSSNIRGYVLYYSASKQLNFCFNDIYWDNYPSLPLNTDSNDPEWHSIARSINEVIFDSSFQLARPTSCYRWFDDMLNLTSITGMEHYLNTSKVTNMMWMFRDCQKVTSLDVRSFNTSNVTNMLGMFDNCESLTSLNVSSFNTSKVTNMRSLFSSCENLTSLNLSGFNTSNVTDMSSMFYLCKKLTSLNVSGFNTSNVTNMKSMFHGCSSLTSLNISNFNLSSLTSSSNMMYGCSGLKTLSISSTANKLDNDACSFVGNSERCKLVYPSGFTPQKTDSGNGWYKWKSGYFWDDNLKSAYAFLSSDSKTLTFYYDTNRYTRTGGTAYGINTGTNDPGWHSKRSSITSVVFNSSFANALPTTCYEWFDGMENLTTITGMVSYLNTSKVTSMEYMFQNCKKLKTLDISIFKFSSPSVTMGMLKNCFSLALLTIPSTANNLTATACDGVGSKAAPCKLVYPSGFTPNKSDSDNGWYLWKSGYFWDDNLKSAYAFLSSDRKTLTFYYDTNHYTRTGGTAYNITPGINVLGWHYWRSSITSVTFHSSFANALPTTCYEWFDGMENLTTITGMVSYLNTSKVTSMEYMFQDCKKLKALDISGFTLSSSTTTTDMLKNCSSLTSLSIPSTANNLAATACTGVGTQSSPCKLVYPSWFTPEKTATGSGWYMWKDGYFYDDNGGIKGDVNGDGSVSLLDIMMCVDYILGKNPADFIFANADMDDNNDISLADIMAIIDIILNQTGS